MRSQIFTVLMALEFASAGIAQTFIVDSSNGPGTDYTSLVAAAANAPDGAVLKVRTGFYFGAVLVDAKGLSVLCDPGATIVTDTDALAVRVTNLAAQQAFTLFGATVQTTLQSLSFYAELDFEDNDGPVLVDRLATQTGGGFRARIRADSCQQVLVRDSSFAGAAAFEDSRVALEQTSINQNATFSAAVIAADSEVQMAGGSLTGFSFTSGPAVELQGSAELRLLADTVLNSGIIGTGSLRIAPTVVVNAGPNPFAPNITVTNIAMPHLTSGSEPLGTPFDVTLAGPSGRIGLVVGGAPSPPLSAPIFSDPWWVDPVGGVPLTAGLTPLLTSVSTPANPSLAGIRLVFQGMSWSGTRFDTSNPSGWIAR